MWIATNFGFFSIVQKDGETDLTVRTRIREDLDELRSRCPSLSPTITRPLADYDYRATVSHQDLAKAMTAICSEISYHNFKDEVAKGQGYERASIYSRVWSALTDLARLDRSRTRAARR